jgi:predicted dehydrogenase
MVNVGRESIVTLKLIHVGLGGWGMDWQKTALTTIRDEVETVAIVEAFAPALEKARKALKLRDDQCFETLDDALEAVPEAEAVLITAPMEAHIPLAMTAMRAGKHVLVEKPLAPAPEEAVEAIRYAEEHGLILQVSQNYRFYPAPIKAAQMIAEGALGDLGTIAIDFRQWDNDAEAGTHKHYGFVHALLYDMAIHHMDLMRMVIGSEPVKVFVQETDPAWSKYVQEASATMLVTFGNGVVVSYRGSWVSSDERTYWAGDWRMECERGLIRWTSRQGGPHGTDGDRVTVRTRDGKTKDVALDPMPVWGRSRGVQAFKEAIATGVPNQNAARNNLPSVALMEASARSMASGEVEDVVVPEV